MYVKYPKTMHLPWSPGLQNDDRLIESLIGFEGKRVIVTEKMDGENATLYHDHYHARSLDSRHHPSRDWIKSYHGSIKHLILPDIRICGENMYAKHSIFYDSLPSYFLGFSIWNERNFCLSWDETIELFEMLDIVSVPVIFDGLWEDFIAAPARRANLVTDLTKEGYVVRVADSFHFSQFQKCVAKFVRSNHIQTDIHWMNAPIIPNVML